MVAFNFRESVSVSVSLSDIASMTAQEWANTVNIIGFLLKFRMETEGGAIRKNKLREKNITEVFKISIKHLRSVFACPFVQ